MFGMRELLGTLSLSFFLSLTLKGQAALSLLHVPWHADLSLILQGSFAGQTSLWPF